MTWRDLPMGAGERRWRMQAWAQVPVLLQVLHGHDVLPLRLHHPLQGCACHTGMVTAVCHDHRHCGHERKDGHHHHQG